ncbi:MAG: class I adenylate-forming enzyme family protein [Chloroflexota bacterium]|nr:MAG: hypothetical protein DLM70_18860 [Chloroflexota bacterium]
MRHIGAAVETWARRTPQATALVTWSATSAPKWCSYEQLNAMARFAADRFRRLPRRGPIALVATSSVESVATLVGLLSAGRTVFPISPTLNPDELAPAMRAAGSRHVVLPTGSLFRGLPGRIVDATEHYVIRALHDEDGDPPHGGRTDERALIQMTSGSLGTSRLAVRSGDGVELEVRSLTERLGLTAGERGCEQVHVLCASSIAHSYGCIGGLLAPLAAGAQVSLADASCAPQMVAAVAPAIVFGLATTFEALLEARLPGGALARVKLAFSAGAPLPGGLFDSMLDRQGLAIRQDYGTTETGTISLDTGTWAAPSTVGTVMDHLQLRLSPPLDQPLDEGEQGEILVRSPAVAHAYSAVDGQVAAVDGDGWYRTRDVGYFDRRQRLCIRRRLRPLLRLPKNAIRPEALETVIRDMPGVHEVVVVGRPHAGASDIRAIVVGPGLEQAAVRAWCRSRLAAEEVPQIIEMRDHLPRSPAGKILQKYLVDPLLD